MSDENKLSYYLTRKPRNLLQESSDLSHSAITNSDIMNTNEASVLDATYNETPSSSITSTLYDRNDINETFTGEVLLIATSAADTFEPLTNCITNDSSKRDLGRGSALDKSLLSKNFYY